MWKFLCIFVPDTNINITNVVLVILKSELRRQFVLLLYMLKINNEAILTGWNCCFLIGLTIFKNIRWQLILMYFLHLFYQINYIYNCELYVRITEYYNWFTEMQEWGGGRMVVGGTVMFFHDSDKSIAASTNPLLLHLTQTNCLSLFLFRCSPCLKIFQFIVIGRNQVYNLSYNNFVCTNTHFWETDKLRFNFSVS